MHLLSDHATPTVCIASLYAMGSYNKKSKNMLMAEPPITLCNTHVMLRAAPSPLPPEIRYSIFLFSFLNKTSGVNITLSFSLPSNLFPHSLPVVPWCRTLPRAPCPSPELLFAPESH